MSRLSDIAQQLLDKLSEVMVGPVAGAVTVSAAASTSDIEVLQGQLGALPDGRRVRVTKSAIVPAGGTATVRARLQHLAPAYPAVGNFKAVDAGTTVTWVSPPTGLAATGTTSAFGDGSRATGLKIGSLVEAESIDDAADLFGAGAQGTTQLALVSPECRVEQIAINAYYSRVISTWTLVVLPADKSIARESRERAREIFDQIFTALSGATAGDDYVRIVSWARAPKLGLNARVLTFTTAHEQDGRDASSADDAALEFIHGTITLPNDGEQPAPFRVVSHVSVDPQIYTRTFTHLDVANAFSTSPLGEVAEWLLPIPAGMRIIGVSYAGSPWLWPSGAPSDLQAGTSINSTGHEVGGDIRIDSTWTGDEIAFDTNETVGAPANDVRFVIVANTPGETVAGFVTGSVTVTVTYAV